MQAAIGYITNINTNNGQHMDAKRSANGKTKEVPEQYRADWLEAMDGRLGTVKAIRERLSMLTDDLGGVDAMSYQRRSLAKRVVWLEAMLEQHEAALARGEEVDAGRWTQGVNSLVGLLKTLGLDRVAQDVPSVQSWIKERSQ